MGAGEVDDSEGYREDVQEHDGEGVDFHHRSGDPVLPVLLRALRVGRDVRRQAMIFCAGRTMSCRIDERRMDPPIDPPDDPPVCCMCKWYYDIGVPYIKRKGDWYATLEGGCCVRKFDDTRSYEDLKYVDSGDEACDEFVEDY